MANINQIELQNLKHFIATASTCNTKFTAYAEACNNAQIKQLINKEETLATFFNS